MNSVNFVTLGCSKNEVDTSLMKSVLNEKKYEVTEDVREAKIIIVNKGKTNKLVFPNIKII